MATQIRFPQGPLIDPLTNYPTIEWTQWFQNPQFVSISFANALGVASGGTGLASGTSGGVLAFTATTTIASSALLGANQIVLGGGAGFAPSTLGALGVTTQVLHGNASGAPSFGAVVLTTDVSGILPLANGGTGNALGNAATVTTNANLTGPITSVGNATTIAPSPSLTTPILGVAAATSINFGQTTLSYYGEGTWTPIDSSGAGLSFTVTDATYTRVGRLVSIGAFLTYPATIDGSAAIVGGFPFTIANFRVAAINSQSSIAGLDGQFQAAGTTMVIRTTANANVTNLQMASAFLIFSGNHEV